MIDNAKEEWKTVVTYILRLWITRKQLRLSLFHLLIVVFSLPDDRVTTSLGDYFNHTEQHQEDDTGKRRQCYHDPQQQILEIETAFLAEVAAGRYDADNGTKQVD